jgi:selenide, water dikinase
LAHVLRHLPTPNHPDLLVGTASGDDAAVWRVTEDRALVATVDVFTPVVDDPRTWGAIAAANSASDVYAMGGTPMFALNIAGWPQAQLSLDHLSDVFAGGSEVAERGKWLIVGGHTIDSSEPFYGQSVVGEVHPDRIIANNTARRGQVIILTKAIGAGLVTTAAKRSELSDAQPGGWLYDSYTAAVASMTMLNDIGARIARAHGVSAGTDITGFGLLGHLHRVALASGVQIRLSAGDVPTMVGAHSLIRRGMVPGGTGRNREYVEAHLDGDESVLSSEATMNLLADPQTSGGLAMFIAADRAEDALAELIETGHQAAIIGHTIAAPSQPSQLSSPIKTLYLDK